ncbi:hypothetical protein [Hymenobacter sp. BRD67]|uniref:hypothetical protein n=1 Tax=Hymenobacter sp. BRD67 TaxID=2675877 RepID=UPI001564439A|nr:hypothetical protein [Hymenobacter sp. BRD67]QKG52353.1 hypothetical protein GKZ67_06675 [Hymenobacter sp. BRD67]
MSRKTLSPDPAARADQRGQRLLFVALLFTLLLTYPLLGVFDQSRRLAGIPLVYLYVLLAWGLLIALTSWLARRGNG